MAHVKTAISMDESIFQEVKELADRMNKSRSELISIAVSRYIEYLKNKKLLEDINAAYEDMPDEWEKKCQQAMKVKHRELLESEKW